MRIVSLVPSWSEFVVDLGLGNQLVGRTKFCTRTPGFEQTSLIVGGTKSFHVERVAQLKPDLIIACKEENTREQVEACAAFSEVYLTDVRSVEQALATMRDLSKALNAGHIGRDWCSRIVEAWGQRREPIAQAAYVIWADPVMVAGADTYIHDVLSWWGIENACADVDANRYPSLTAEYMKNSPCECALLSSEPFPFQELDKLRFQTWASHVELVDGEAFSWYGSRMLHAVPYFKSLHQQLRQLRPA